MEKKNFAVRLATFALALITVLSAGAMLSFAADTVTYVAAYDSMWGAMMTNLPFDSEEDSLGERIFINGEFSSLKVSIATYRRTDACVTAQVFKWNRSYEKTLQGTPIYENRFEKVSDNGVLELALGQTCEAGEYLILFSKATGTLNMEINGKMDSYGYFTVLCRSMNKKGLGCVYVNGVEQLYDMYMEVGFVGEVPAEPFKTLITFEDASPNNASAIANSQGLMDYWDIGSETKVMGQRIKVSAPIDGFAFATPTWGNPNCSTEVKAYIWNETYDKTVAGDPFATAQHKDVGDRAANWVIFDETMPAGEYLFTISQTGGTRVAVYFYTTNASGGYAYVDGAEFRNDLHFIVRFQNKLNGQQPFLPCDGEDDRSDGTVTVPEQWQPAEDSLLNTHKVQPTTWVFTDGLGRESWEYGENGVGAVNEDKVLAMFYWNWHLRAVDWQQAFNIQNFIQQYPEAKNDYNHAGWNDNQQYYWNEPIYGYYDTTDTWVLRRHAELLANASIDTVFTDNTNAVMTFRNGYMAMYEQWTKAQNDGVNSPKISFQLPIWYAVDGNTPETWWTSEQIEYLYADIYRRGQYQNLWFWFDGKPMVMANLGNNANLKNSDDAIFNEIMSFFTYRAGVSAYNDQDLRTPENRIGSWDWLSKYPQATYASDKTDLRKGKVEEMSVGIAQNHDFKKNELTAMNGPRTMGRSYTSDNNTRYHDSQKNEVSETTKWGYNFEEQWNYALEVDPKVVFVTGWNEWTVSRKSSWVGVSNSFGDQFNDEYSRDIEPTKGALKDYYYYQLINYTRKFKGAEEMPVPTAKATINLSKGLEAQWEGVGPYFAAYIGNVMNRDSYGRVGAVPYRDFSGRNDIIGAQIARDDEYVYFNVECNEDITPYTDKLWMNLYIDVDQKNKGWETFDYVVNKTAASKTTSVLEKFTDGYTSEKVADVEYKVDGKFMTIKIAKSDLGISGDDYTINFAWTDNVHDSDDKGAITKNGWVYSDFSGDIMDFYTSGDVAPGARFKFSYISTAKNAAGLPEVDPETSTPAETTKPIEPTTTAPVTTPTTTPADTETSEPANTTTPADKETSTPAEITTAAPATTTAPSTTTAAPEVTTEADKGCGSVIALSAISVLTALGAAVVLKKKED